MEEDALELRMKLDYALRSLEEKSLLLDALRVNVQTLASDKEQLETQIGTLKEVQDELLRQKAKLEHTADQALREKAELASEAARLHVYARDAASRAEQAVRQARELKAESDARSKADAAVLYGNDSNGVEAGAAAIDDAAAALAETAIEGGTLATTATTRRLEQQLAASRLLVARLLGLVERAGISVRLKDLLQGQPPQPQAGDAAGSLAAQRLQPLERELLLAALSRLGYSDIEEQSRRVGMAAPASSSFPLPASERSSRPWGGSAAAGDDAISPPLRVTGVPVLHNNRKQHVQGSPGGDDNSGNQDGASAEQDGAGAEGTEWYEDGDEPGATRKRGVLSPITRPFVALGHNFWSTLVGNDEGSSSAAPTPQSSSQSRPTSSEAADASGAVGFSTGPSAEAAAPHAGPSA